MVLELRIMRDVTVASDGICHSVKGVFMWHVLLTYCHYVRRAFTVAAVECQFI